MFNLDFLNIGEYYPPIEEAKRLGAYIDYDLMADGNTYASEERHFKRTVENLNKLALKCGWGDMIGAEYNFFKLNSKKTADFVCGESPAVKYSAKDDGQGDEATAARNQKLQKVVDEIRQGTEFDKKIWDCFYDVSKYGFSALRVYRKKEGEQKNTFTINKPAMIIKVVDPEDLYEVQCYVVSWIVEKTLFVRIHYRGYYEEREYEVESRLSSATVLFTNNLRYTVERQRWVQKNESYVLVHDLLTAEFFRWIPYEIIRERKGARKTVQTGLDDFAVIEIENLKDSESIYGASDYEDIDSLIAMNHRIVGEVQLIFDRYTLPTAYGDPSVLEQDATGENVYRLGTFWATPEGGVTPGFLQPDMGQLQQYYEMLRYNDTKIKELSEMGAVYGTDSEAANGISTETMKARFNSAITKARRLAARNTAAIKKLFHLLSLSGYGETIDENEIDITWFDGLPNDDEADERVVTARLANGTTSRKREMTERQGLSPEAAEAIMQEKLEEDSDFATLQGVNWLADEDKDEEGGDGGGGDKNGGDGEKRAENDEELNHRNERREAAVKHGEKAEIDS